MADPIKVAKHMFGEFLSKHDPNSDMARVPDIAEVEDRIALASKGGHARAESLSLRKRRQIAKRAARARWGKSK